MAAERNIWTLAKAALPATGSAVLSDEAKALLQADQSPRQFVAVLTAQGLGADAVRFIPWALTRREAIWWAAQCVKAVPVLIESPASRDAILSAEAWCADPSDEHRRKALTASELSELSTPAGCVAMAVFFSEGSIAPPTVQAVDAPPQIGPNMAGNAVLLAAVVKNPEKALEKYSKFIQLADDVATGLNLWKGAKPPPAAVKSDAPPSPPGAKVFPPYPTPKR